MTLQMLSTMEKIKQEKGGLGSALKCVCVWLWVIFRWYYHCQIYEIPFREFLQRLIFHGWKPRDFPIFSSRIVFEANPLKITCWNEVREFQTSLGVALQSCRGHNPLAVDAPAYHAATLLRHPHPASAFSLPVRTQPATQSGKWDNCQNRGLVLSLSSLVRLLDWFTPRNKKWQWLLAS